MKYTRKDLSKTLVKLQVVVNEKDLLDVQKLSIAKLSKDIKVPGFRSGKVPVNVAQKHLDKSVIASQLLDDSINKFVIEAIEKEDLKPLDRPKVDVDEYEPASKLGFTAQVEVLPVIKLGNYKKLKAKKPESKISEKDIDEVIDRMRLGMAQKNEVNRPAKNDDEVWIDFEGKDSKGELVPGASGKDYPLKLGSNTFIPGFEEGLVGHKAGDKFSLKLTFPKDYHHKPLAGAKVTFEVSVKKVNELTLPKVDKEFIAKAGPFSSEKELREDIRRELTARKEQDNENELKDNLLEQLVSVSEIPIPDVLINDQIESLEKDTVQNLAYRGLTLESFLSEQGLTREQWREKELKPMAERRVQVGLALAELSKVENIQITREELDMRHAEMLEKYPDPGIRSQLDTPEARRDLANRVLTEKTVDHLLALNLK